MTRTEKSLLSMADAIQSRPGGAVVNRQMTTAAPSSGLDLSDVIMKPRSWFIPNPENNIFRALKTDSYFKDLERDIAEAGAIINPLIALSDGLLLEGESRLLVAGRLGMERLPVRIVLSPMTEEEQRRRLWLGNLSRFEVDKDTRLFLYAKIWPGYFAGEAHASAVAVADIVKATGSSKRQVIRDAGIVREARAKASEEGREATVQDLREVREGKNAERRQEAPAKAPDFGITKAERSIIKVRQASVTLRRMAKEAETGDAYDDGKAYAYNYAANMIEEALL